MMITLHIIQLLQNEGFGTIDAPVNGLFWEKLPLNSTGVAIFSRGTELGRGLRSSQAFDLYSRGTSDLRGADNLEKIMEYIEGNFVQCDLPLTAKSNKQYKKATIVMTSNVENLGLDENDRLIFRISAEVNYNKGA